MALQLHGLQAGLDFLGRHADRLGVAGASGGAVQALYLLLVDPRPEVAALASMVSIPREARASGCPCDVLPGWEGPDPALLAAIPRPVLWMTEVEGTPRPEGLASRVDYQVHPGAHGFEAPMRQAMLVFFGKHLGGGTEAIEPPYTPQESLASDSVGERGLGQLVAALPEQGLLPVRQASGPAWTLDCQGSGPRVLTLGVEAEDSEALEGFERCAITLRLDELGPTQGIVTGRPYADAIASSLVAAAGEDPLYAVGPWAVPVSRSGLVYVARDPLQEPTHSDPEWVHLPGFWDHGRYAEALAVSADPRELAEALQKR